MGRKTTNTTKRSFPAYMLKPGDEIRSGGRTLTVNDAGCSRSLDGGWFIPCLDASGNRIEVRFKTADQQVEVLN